METVNDVVIIGSGPAAHTAAIYLGRASIKPITYEGFLAGGIAAGGQLTTTTIIENFPGFPSGIDGNELMLQMRKQSENNGATIITETISKVEVMWNSTLIELVGDGNLLNGAKVKNVVTGEEKVVPISGLFYAIGHAPNVQFLNGQLKLTPEGYIEVNETKTSVDGVFAAGDVCDKVYRQAIVAAGSGCKAALDCEKWLQTH
uniref:Thioredoxin reductase, putative n=1 Tax=Entamoeba invadens TaxID=33085 RepID=S0B3Y6_ENTIV|nr:thioredoxin reductase, putative [Entamoeba invadens]